MATEGEHVLEPRRFDGNNDRRGSHLYFMKRNTFSILPAIVKFHTTVLEFLSMVLEFEILLSKILEQRCCSRITVTEGLHREEYIFEIKMKR